MSDEWIGIEQVAAEIGYPPLVLIYDAFLNFLMTRPTTITADVSSTRDRRIEVCMYPGVWFVVFGLHSLLGWFDGFSPTAAVSPDPR